MTVPADNKPAPSRRGTIPHGQTAQSAIAFDDDLRSFLAASALDYLAVGGGDSRQTLVLNEGTAHNPGATQGRFPTQTGSHGCTLVDVDAGGTIRCTAIPTAPVRWERLTIAVDGHTSWDELIEVMRATLKQSPPESNEDVWLIDWIVRGWGPLFDSLGQENFRSELLDLFEQDRLLPERLLRTHRFLTVPVTEPTGSAVPDNHFAAQYLQRLDDEHPLTRETLLHCLEHADLPDDACSGRLESWIDGLDHDAIVAHARRRGMAWFASRREEGASS